VTTIPPATQDHERLDRLITDIGRDLAAIVARMHRLIERDHIPAANDGYPRRASGAQPTSAPTPIHDELEGGVAIDYADPTGDAALTPAPLDPVSRSVSAIWRRLDDAATDLLRAAEMARNLTAPTGIPELEHPWCAHHYLVTRPDGERIQRPLAWRADRLRYAKDRLCSWCGEFREAHGVLPPLELIGHLERHPGARLTPALVQRYLKPQAGPTERGKRKKGWQRAARSA
jgi:hypothetical protein